MTSLRKYAAFVSHNTADQALAIELNDRFAVAGHDTFLAQDELKRKPAKAVHAACYEALSHSLAVLVCVGPAGIGPSQRYEIDTALQLESEGQLEIVMILLGSATREDIPRDYPNLRAKLSFAYPSQDGQPKVKDLITYLHKRAEEISEQPEVQPTLDSATTATVSAAARETEAETAADDLAKSVVDYGLTAFVGSLWPERDRQAVFNPDEVAVDLLRDVGIPVPDPDRVMSFERAALCFTVARGGGRPGETESEKEILRKIREMFSLVSPEAFAQIPRLSERLSQRDPSRTFEAHVDRRPMLLVTTNVDRLLERSFVKRKVPFLKLVARCDGGVEQALFEKIEEFEDERIRIETRLDSASRPIERETEVYDRKKRDEGPFARPFRERSKVLSDHTPQQIWRELQIDYAIRTHSRSVTVTDTGADPHALERMRSDCLNRGIPILLKLFGCIDSRSDCGLGLNKLFRFSRNSEWIPQDIRTWMGDSASLFLGFSHADLRFVHFFEYALHEIFESKSQQRRMLVCPSQSGPRDGHRDVVRVLMQTLNGRPDDKMDGIVAVDDEPKSFLERLLARELTRGSIDV